VALTHQQNISAMLMNCISFVVLEQCPMLETTVHYICALRRGLFEPPSSKYFIYSLSKAS